MGSFENSYTPESLTVKLGQNIEEGEGRAAHYPVGRRGSLLDVHRQRREEEFQTEVCIKASITWRNTERR